MKRAVFVVVSFAVLGVIPVSFARPRRAPRSRAAAPPPAQTAAPSTTVTIYYKPSKGGVDTAAHGSDKARATLSCNADTAHPESNFTIVIANGQAYCKAAMANVNTAPVLCQGGATLTTDDKFSPAVKAAFKQADACLKASSPADAAASYVKPICGTNSTGGGFMRQTKPGPDTCEKVINSMRLQTPGEMGGALTLPTAIGAGKEVTPTQAQVDSRAVRCPPGASLEQAGNGVVCKATANSASSKPSRPAARREK